jgi:hypothetical protein
MNAPSAARTAPDQAGVTAATSGAAVPYGIIAECFRTHSVVPFLGSAASFVGAPAAALPGGRAFARLLAEKSGYPGPPTDALTKVAQFLEEIPADRTFLLDEFMHRFDRDVPPDYRSAFTDFLGHLPAERVPRLILTTNYDTLVERTLERRGVPYLAISHGLRGSKYAGRLICYGALGRPLDESAIFPLRRLDAPADRPPVRRDHRPPVHPPVRGLGVALARAGPRPAVAAHHRLDRALGLDLSPAVRAGGGARDPPPGAPSGRGAHAAGTGPRGGPMND